MAGDSAFDRVVGLYGESLSRIAWGYVENATDHDDLMQDVLVAIWRALPRFRGESSERTFVFRIVHNRGSTFLSRRRDHEQLTAELSIPDPRPGPDEEIDRARQHARLLAAVRTLSEPQRQAVMLRLEGFSIQEISAMQDATENNVSVRLTRARDRLRELLGDDDR
jgi:RNA polymerase sigma-70 factor, ECF subfamily